MNFPPMRRICEPGRAPVVLGKAAVAAFTFLTSQVSSAADMSEADRAAFTDKYCTSCHNDVDKEGGFDLTTLAYQPNDPVNFLQWVKVHDRVQSGEMPPKEKKRPDATETSGFIKSLATSLTTAEQASVV